MRRKYQDKSVVGDTLRETRTEPERRRGPDRIPEDTRETGVRGCTGGLLCSVTWCDNSVTEQPFGSIRDGPRSLVT